MTSKEALEVFSSMSSLEICKAVEYKLEEQYGKVPEIDKIWLSIIKKDLKVLECFKKYFDFELLFEDNQTFLVFKSKERYLPVNEKISVANKYYEPLKDWLKR